MKSEADAPVWFTFALDPLDQQLVILSVGETEQDVRAKGYPRAGEDACYKGCFDLNSKAGVRGMVYWLRESGVPPDEVRSMMRQFRQQLAEMWGAEQPEGG